MSQQFNQTITTVTNLPSFGTAIVMLSADNVLQLTITTPTDADVYFEVWGTTDTVSSNFLMSASATDGKPIPRNTTQQTTLHLIGPAYSYTPRLWTNAADSNNRTVTIGGSI